MIYEWDFSVLQYKKSIIVQGSTNTFISINVFYYFLFIKKNLNIIEITVESFFCVFVVNFF